MITWLKKQMERMTHPDLDWVQVEVTTHCNASCSYCPHTALKDGWVNRHMPLDLFQQLLPFLNTTKLVFLQGWGEPLLNPALFDMIRLSKRQGNLTGFTTNGMLLTEATARKIVDMELDILGVSIAGTRAETHNKIRQGTDLDKIIHNFERLQKLKDEKGGDFPEVHLAYLVLKDNFDELREIAPLARRMGANDVVVSNLSLLVDPGSSRAPVFTDTEKGDIYRIGFEQIKKEAEANGIRFSYNGPGLNPLSPKCGENVSRSCVISVGGEVVPCVMTDPVLSQNNNGDLETYATYIFEGRNYPLKEMVFGRIGDETLTQIWNNRAYQSFRNLFASNAFEPAESLIDELPQRCRMCYKRLLE